MSDLPTTSALEQEHGEEVLACCCCHGQVFYLSALGYAACASCGTATPFQNVMRFMPTRH